MDTNSFRAPRPPAGDLSPAHGQTSASRPGAWLEERVAGRSWVVRAPLLLVLAWVLRGYLTEPASWSLFSAITLAFHEMGHVVFSWTGHHILATAGGTIAQLLVPAGAAAYLILKQRDPFGATVCLFWLGAALVDAGVYAADARAQALPLVSPFGPVDTDSHDWTVLLMKFGLLSKDQAVGSALSGAGKVTMALSLAAGVWVLRVMARARSRAQEG